MDSGIEFGQVEHQRPDRQVRPDRNRQFRVVACGNIDENDLPIFVDLDVMRDMEAHARTNTHVELGGVLLGGQYLDSDGEPFVVVREALRAEHYEATRGSFKFTHETWAQITRDREQFPKDLQLVGWYHTHPDWGVFLSGMDMFICENFFNRPLDIALVIDPCRGDRGWFYWTGDAPGQKKRPTGYYLMTNRFRDAELSHFADSLGRVDPAFADPRYSSPSGDYSGDFAVQPAVHFHDQRSPWQSVAMMGMLTIQLLVVALIAFRVLAPPAAEPPGNSQSNAPLQTTASERLYREILNQLVNPEPGSENLVDHFQNIAEDNRMLRTSLEGQTTLIEHLKQQQQKLTAQRDQFQVSLENAQAAIVKNKDQIIELETEIAKQKKQLAAAGLPTGFWSRGLSWPWAIGLAMLTALVGVIASHLYHRGRMLEDFDSGGNSSPRGSREDDYRDDDEPEVNA